ncbi:PAS domain-containing sensor histidine kinase [Cellulophaga baltica]|uniref:sensor histidine kinase n=1 Tax=Cellulophaga TaxID=104264 RepID=UPI001C074602|nr:MULTISPECIES: ATP-binding protein [Cellulophaga]MBU2997870.1 PAS domain-containing sensor histidine kinase [Cellulophaga baltica]MDO6769271.1 ATP-binding protein [Cellulophaga sp. 1_MG-2023]
MEYKHLEFNNELRGAFFDMAYSPFVILNENLDFIDMNRAVETTLNIEKSDFLGKNILTFFPKIKDNGRLEMYKSVLKTGEPIGFDDVLLETSEGTLNFIIKAFKIGNCLGITTLNVTGLANTIDQLKKTKVNLEATNNKLKRKNEELEEFSYVMSHDLRAPLTNMGSLFKMLMETNGITEEGAPIFEKAVTVGKLMCEKIKALNNVMSIKSNVNSKEEEIKFIEVLNKFKTNNSEKIIENRTIIKEDFSCAPIIKYNNLQLESIIHNLISNAIKYKHPKRKPVINIKTKIENNKINLIVKDNGIGFDDTVDKDKIFGLFKRMHDHVDGLGVGLHIIHSVVVNNGGNIEVKSELNKGTEFKITF